jgi:hypothetical protein
MVSLCIGPIQAKYNVLNYSVGPVKNGLVKDPVKNLLPGLEPHSEWPGSCRQICG